MTLCQKLRRAGSKNWPKVKRPPAEHDDDAAGEEHLEEDREERRQTASRARDAGEDAPRSRGRSRRSRSARTSGGCGGSGRRRACPPTSCSRRGPRGVAAPRPSTAVVSGEEQDELPVRERRESGGERSSRSESCQRPQELSPEARRATRRSRCTWRRRALPRGLRRALPGARGPSSRSGGSSPRRSRRSGSTTAQASRDL